MIHRTSSASPRAQARIAGFLYLIIIVAGAAHDGDGLPVTDWQS